MILIRLVLENFRQHVDTTIEFTPGVTGIVGANGSGKTTILEAIAWALYGAPAVRGNNESVRSHSHMCPARAPAAVTLEFELSNHVYTASRRLVVPDKTKGNSKPRCVADAVLTCDGQAISAGMSEVSESVARLLGMNYRAFFTSFFTEQKQLTFMAGMDGRQKAAAISRMLGYDRLTRARDKANSDRLGLDREISGLEQGLGNPEDINRRLKDAKKAVTQAEKLVKEAQGRSATIEKQVAKLTPLKELSDQKAKRYDELTRRLQLDKMRQEQAVARREELDKTLAGIAGMADELKKIAPQLQEFKDVEAEYRKLQDLQKHEAERQRIAGQIDRLRADCVDLEKQIRELSGACAAQQEASDRVSALEKELTQTESQARAARDEWMTKRAAAGAEADRLKAHHTEVSWKRAEIEAAGSEGRCPTCERELGDDLKTVIANFDVQLGSAAKRLIELDAELASLQNEPVELAKLTSRRTFLEKDLAAARKAKEESDAAATKLATAQKDLTTKRVSEKTYEKELEKLPKGFDQEKLNRALARGRELRPIKDKSIALETDIAKGPTLEIELKQLVGAIELRQKEIDEVESSLSELSFSSEDHQKLCDEFQVVSAQLSVAQLETERLRGDARAAMAELTGVEAEDRAYKEKEAQLREKRTERLYLQTLSDCFDKLRIDLDTRARPELEAAASELLSEMTDGRYNSIEIDDKYEATIRDDGELKPVISGGEDDVINLALRLAISEMIAERAGQPFSLLILDEVFGSLDDSRRNNVMEMLLNLKNRFRQIIVITHVESIYDMVDNCIWVDYDEREKISRVTDKRPEVAGGYE